MHEIGFLADASADDNPLLLAQVYLDNVVIVPEPSSALLGLVGLLPFALRRRRS